MGGMETSARMLVRRPKVGDEAAHESWWRVPRRARGPCVANCPQHVHVAVPRDPDLRARNATQ